MKKSFQQIKIIQLQTKSSVKVLETALKKEMKWNEHQRKRRWEKPNYNPYGKGKKNVSAENLWMDIHWFHQTKTTF